MLLVCVILLPLRISVVTDRQVVIDKNIPIQIVLDVSLSMSANDLQPSRFVAAKSSLISLIQQLDGYSISLITFS
ncbi:MAG: VWA domain-containing protein [bacterium]